MIFHFRNTRFRGFYFPITLELTGDDDTFAEMAEIPDDSMELAAGPLGDAGVVGLGDTEVLLVEVHQVHLVVGDLLLFGRLEHEGDGVGLVMELAVAEELVEPVGPQGDGHQRRGCCLGLENNNHLKNRNKQERAL